MRFLRESLAEVLPREGPLLIEGLFSNLHEALVGIVENQSDIVLLDEAFPNGAAAVAQIRCIAPQVLVVAIAVAETADEVIAWAEAGVAGYIPSTASLADMRRLMVEIRRGEQACSANIAAALLRRLSNGAAKNSQSHGSAPLPMFTAREEQIAQLIVAGASNKDIARRLNIGLATAKTHVHNLLGKLKMQSRGKAAGWMREHGNRQ